MPEAPAQISRFSGRRALRGLLWAALILTATAALLGLPGRVAPDPAAERHALELYRRAGGLSGLSLPGLPAIAPRPAPAAQQRPQRVIVLALDGLDPAIAAALIEQGRMPNLERVLERGAWGPLAGAANNGPINWTTAFTGRSPAEHGIARNDRRLEYLGALEPAELRARRVWELAAEAGLSYGAYAAPFVRPRPATDDLVAPGFALGRWPRFLPASVTRAGCGLDGDPAEHDFLELKLCALLHAPHRLDVVRLRALEGGVRVGLAEFLVNDPNASSVDRPGALIAEHAAFDQALGRLLDSLTADQTLLICSDHGFDLERAGSFKLLLGPAVLAAFGLEGRDLWSETGHAVDYPGTLRVKARWELLTWRLGPADRFGRPLLIKALAQTLVFYGDRLAQGDLYKEVRGRLDNTVGPDSALFDVDPLDFRAAVLRPNRQGLIALLEDDDPARDRLAVLRPEIELRDDAPPAPGLIALYGAGIRPGPIQGAQLVDVAPTVLALLGLPLSDELDGRPLEQALLFAPGGGSVASYETRPIERSGRLDGAGAGCGPATQDPLVRRRLRLLGYQE